MEAESEAAIPNGCNTPIPTAPAAKTRYRTAAEAIPAASALAVGFPLHRSPRTRLTMIMHVVERKVAATNSGAGTLKSNTIDATTAVVPRARFLQPSVLPPPSRDKPAAQLRAGDRAWTA